MSMMFSFSRVTELYELVDVTADTALSDKYSDQAAAEIELLSQRQPSNLSEAIESLQLASMLAHDEHLADFIDHAFNLTEKRGRTLEAIIALRKANEMVERHADFGCLAKVLEGLIAYMSSSVLVSTLKVTCVGKTI